MDAMKELYQKAVEEAADEITKVFSKKTRFQLSSVVRYALKKHWPEYLTIKAVRLLIDRGSFRSWSTNSDNWFFVLE